jgi:hypothetical protein
MTGSRIESPNAGEICHMFFGKAIRTLFATHPPLTDRIYRLQPDFSGQFIPTTISDEEPAPLAPEPPKPELDAAMQPVAGFVIGADSVIKRPGNITPQNLNRSRQLLAAIPETVKNELSNTLGSICVTCALLLEKDSTLKARQIKSLQKVAPEDVIRQILLLENDSCGFPSWILPCRFYDRCPPVSMQNSMSLFRSSWRPTPNSHFLNLRCWKSSRIGWERPSNVIKGK